jgi:hypothetical protein
MDPELKVVLAALVEGQVKLSDGQGARTDAAVQRFSDRQDGSTMQVGRGFTRGISAERRLEDRVHAPDARVTNLERRSPPPTRT